MDVKCGLLYKAYDVVVDSTPIIFVSDSFNGSVDFRMRDIVKPITSSTSGRSGISKF